jgi:hypothetical protein
MAVCCRVGQHGRLAICMLGAVKFHTAVPVVAGDASRVTPTTTFVQYALQRLLVLHCQWLASLHGQAPQACQSWCVAVVLVPAPCPGD